MKKPVSRTPARILVGNVLDRIKEIKDESVQCVVTSPPYWGLRDYGTATWEGGDPTCEHSISMDTKWNDPKRGTKVLRPETGHRGGSSSNCHKCGAIRIDDQIGLEETPEEYIEKMVLLFREVHRILAKDGVLWLNLGDSYAGNNSRGSNGQRAGFSGNKRELVVNRTGNGLKPKDLVGIPWRVALALQADGWYLRQDIIWHKPNPMPESVKDRCTKSHEYVFMLTKNQRYYFDSKSIEEPAKWDRWGKQTVVKEQQGTAKWIGEKTKEELQEKSTKNKRSVWTIATKPFKGAHFAVMPETLAEPCVLASSRENDIVYDPFTGSGTVAVVALRHNRRFIGTELNPDYALIAQNRIGKVKLL